MGWSQAAVLTGLSQTAVLTGLSQTAVLPGLSQACHILSQAAVLTGWLLTGHRLVTDWSQTGYQLVTDWLPTGDRQAGYQLVTGWVTDWSQTGLWFTWGFMLVLGLKSHQNCDVFLLFSPLFLTAQSWCCLRLYVQWIAAAAVHGRWWLLHTTHSLWPGGSGYIQKWVHWGQWWWGLFHIAL